MTQAGNGDASRPPRRKLGAYQLPTDQDGVAVALLAAGDRRGAAAEQNLLALRVEQRLEWEEIVGVPASGGERVSAPALRKRFERLKDRIGKLALELGVIE